MTAETTHMMADVAAKIPDLSVEITFFRTRDSLMNCQDGEVATWLTTVLLHAGISRFLAEISQK